MAEERIGVWNIPLVGWVESRSVSWKGLGCLHQKVGGHLGQNYFSLYFCYDDDLR